MKQKTPASTRTNEDRDIFNEPHFDPYEEAALAKIDERQMHLPGVYTAKVSGCPHRQGKNCEIRNYETCLVHMGDRCRIFTEIINSWRKEMKDDKTYAMSGSGRAV